MIKKRNISCFKIKNDKCKIIFLSSSKNIHYKEARREGNNALAETSVAKNRKNIQQ